MHPALKNVLVFIVGALFGAVCSFIFVILHAGLLSQTSLSPQVPGAGVLLQNTVPTRPTPQPSNAITPATANVSQSALSQPATPTAASTADTATSQAAASTTSSNDPIQAPIAPPTERPSSTLLIPVAGIQASQLVDTYTQARSGGRVHDAIDIMAPRGTQVIAADDGKVAKLFYSKPGGLTVYQFDPTEKFVYYYAHLDSYAPGLVEGKQLHRGDPVGLVGFSGNASESAPHLHFAVSVLGPEKHWWQATAINPYPLLSGH
jgi:murein DD-endopeptidase MepM/ murein hydrolase activator NlpD